MVKMPKADPNTIARFVALLPTNKDIVVRPMFGHRAAFVNGSMFAGTFGPDVVVRVDDASRAALFRDGARPFEPMKGRPMKEYAMLPPTWVTEGTRARHWIGIAFAWVAGQPAKSKEKSKGTKKAKPRTLTSRP